MKELGPYQLIERLGVGGMAEVFLAHARRQGDFVQPCVVKVLHKELVADKSFTRILLEEARLIARLRHNNIAGLLDVGRHDGALFLVMEFVDGRDLHAILSKSVQEKRELPVAFAMHVAKNLCTGLHFAHTRQGSDGKALRLVHRDVSPQNVLVSALGEVKLIDFGVAKFNSNVREKTRAGIIKGKFGYMSPEQAWDEPLDHRSDIFAVGICLYEMLTGRSVYGQNDDALTMLKRAREADIEAVTQWRTDVPDDLARIVHRALERNRENRYQSAHQFERELAMAMAKWAPDFTNLDAGVLMDELFDIGDPALASRSPRIDAANRASGPVATIAPPSAPSAPVEENTHPMTEVPEKVQRSGAFRQRQRVAVDTDDGDSTVALTFSDDDFADEKTRVFDEHQISGAYPTVERDSMDLSRNGNGSSAAAKRAKKALGRDPALHTRRIKEQKDQIEEKDTDPHHETPVLAADEPTFVRHVKISPPKGDDPPPHPRPPISQTDKNRIIEAAEPAEPAEIRRDERRALTPPEGVATDDGGPSLDFLQDRRFQIAAAVAFVIIALLFALSRLMG